MLNKILIIILVIKINILTVFFAQANEQFNFNISEIEILDNGNKVIGSNRGDITTNNGLTISANSFEYDKVKNILNANGNVIINDQINDYKIFSNDIIYVKDEETIYSNDTTKAEIHSKYEITSNDLVFSKNQSILYSNNKTKIIDKISKTLYSLDRFNFDILNEILKGEKLLINMNYNLPENNKLYFDNGIFDLKKKSFVAKDVNIQLKKNIFDNIENDPRLKGVSANSKNNITTINKGIFTSCKKKDGCPPWLISAKKITHDKDKKQLIYKDAVLKVYNIPILYFPKFFHPDPTVNRQSGLLKPEMNNSNILGSSISIPYYQVMSHNKDFTFRPSIFDKDIKMFQSEYRQENKNSSLIVDFGYTDGYQSTLSNQKNSISHLFAKFDADLTLDKFKNSDFFLQLQKVSNDTYLKVFDGNLFKSKIHPQNFDILSSEAKLTLDHENYNFSTGFQSFENLQKKSSDRYQYILPYYNFERRVFNNFDYGAFSFSSSGNNDLNNTNNLKTKVINNLNFNSSDIITDRGFKNNYNVYFKNLNIYATNDSKYKSSPQVELLNLVEFNSSLPLINMDEENIDYLTPKISLRFNPGDMKNYSESDRFINVDNIFNIDRLGIDDSFEEGKSLTLGLDYRKSNLSDINKFFEAKIATVFRDDEENFIPKKSGINKKNTNFFGSITNNFSEFMKIDYDFIVDNDLNNFEYNSISTTLNYKNFKTNFNFIEESDIFGGTNTLENKTTLKLNNDNYLSFSTRRNRKIDLTEYYNLVYEYKNDCLVAGIKYKKTYYEDRDLKPSENLFFTITLSPLTSFEQKVDQ